MRLPIRLKYIPRNRREKRKVINEGKIVKELSIIENNFIQDIFTWAILDKDIESSFSEDVLTYNDIYLHHKAIWDRKLQWIIRNRKNIEVDKHYFSDLYSPVEVPKQKTRWLRKIL